MNRETEIALKNYDWLIRRDGLDEIGLHWESGTLILRNGGASIESLFAKRARLPRPASSKMLEGWDSDLRGAP
jgi:hypothetical protein